ncbi:MAG: ankyrin repeat domain-containing protein, partial [Muribaculaceae bacterium]|nr:ankyrin repeat domain-containing protein [Muribaculaceae bacterium]
LLAVVSLFSGCVNIDNPVDKSELWAGDYRLFQGTSVWPLARAAHYGDMSGVRDILRDSPWLADVRDSIYGNTMLMISILHQDYKLFKLLIDSGADINYHNTYEGKSPLIEACCYMESGLKFVKVLVEKGANVNDTTTRASVVQVSALMVASGFGTSSMVEYLIKEGADINYRNNYGTTPLGEAMLSGRYDIALILLNNGADFTSPVYNALDDKGNSTVPTMLPNALRNDMVEIGSPEYSQKREVIKFLRTKGIDYDTVPIPDYVIKEAKEKFPSRWREYLQRY